MLKRVASKVHIVSPGAAIGNGLTAVGIAAIPLSKYLGYNETQLMHPALKKLAQEVLPAYERDDGLVSAATFKALKKREPQGKLKIVVSNLFHTQVMLGHNP